MCCSCGAVAINRERQEFGSDGLDFGLPMFKLRLRLLRGGVREADWDMTGSRERGLIVHQPCCDTHCTSRG